MKDYYRLLQVHPEAESEVMAAAYKRLMRKYHPDLLPPELRDDPETLQKAKDINEAYAVLSNPARRAEYDRTLKQQKQATHASAAVDEPSQTRGEEKAFLYVRCGQTTEIFKALLVRDRYATDPYKVMGFIPVPTLSAPPKASIFSKAKRLFNRDNTRAVTKSYSFAELDMLADDGIHRRLDKPNFTMGDIDWGQHTCPACSGSIQNENGTISTWIGCSKCGRIRCAGDVQETSQGRFSTCPWCGKRNKLTRSIKPGSKDHLQLQGLEKKRETSKPANGLLKDSSSQDLLEKGKTK